MNVKYIFLSYHPQKTPASAGGEMNAALPVWVPSMPQFLPQFLLDNIKQKYEKNTEHTFYKQPLFATIGIWKNCPILPNA